MFAAFPQLQLLLIVISVVVFTLIVTIVLTPVAEWLGLVDRPGGRKQHLVPTPAIGGLVIYLVILSVLFFLNPPPKLIWMIASAGILVGTGVIDDAFGLGIKIRFCSQVLAAAIMVFGSGLYLSNFGLGADFSSPVPSWLAIIFTIFALVGLTNGFNMADGIDGLAAGHMLIGLMLVCVTMAISSGDIPQIEWFAALFVGVFIFFMINVNLTPLRKVFLGDAGSMLLGFVMGWTLIYCSQEPNAAIHPVAALWCVAIPVWDTIFVIVRRLKNKQSPFAPDRHHFHHLLIAKGLTPKNTLVVILIVAFVISTLGVVASYAVSPLFAIAVFIFFTGILCLGVLHPSIERIFY